ncbi:MAG: extracellular solute-binding protein, partial [Fibrobacterota bacterium]
NKKPKTQEPLLCFVGGTMRPAMEEIKKDYEAKTGKRIEFNQGESGTLIVQIAQTQKGDLYVCHDPFQGGLKNKGFELQSWVMASLCPVLVVQKGNPKKVTGLKGLGEKGLRVILTHPEYSTLGHMVPVMGRKAGVWDAIKANVVSETRSGGEAANAVALGTADAAVVWNAVAFLRADKLDTVSIEPDFQLKSGVDAITSATYGLIDMGNIRVTISTLTCSKQPEAAKAFAEFAASAEMQPVWKKHGFSVAVPSGL